MITEDDKFSFSDVKLVSKTGKFYIEQDALYKTEVTEEMFKSFLILAANMKSMLPKPQRNSIEYLMNQLEVTEDLFTAMMYSYNDWTN